MNCAAIKTAFTDYNMRQTSFIFHIDLLTDMFESISRLMLMLPTVGYT